MPSIKLFDGKKIPFTKKIDGFEIANKISKSLSKEACIMKVNGKLKDLSFLIDSDAEVKIITKSLFPSYICNLFSIYARLFNTR